MDEEGRHLPVIAKVEKPQAVENIDEIVAAFDGIMVAPRDLGVEMPLEQVPIVQKRAIKLAKRNAKPVIVATQMLDSMIENSRPTRAEASDVAKRGDRRHRRRHALRRDQRRQLPRRDGQDDGPHRRGRRRGHPRQGPPAAHREQQAPDPGRSRRPCGGGDGDFLGAKFLVAFTQSGDTVRRLSRYRSPIPCSFTPEPATRSQLNLTWGVETFLGPHVDSTDAMVDQVDELLLKYGRCRRGDIVVITAGSPPGVSGSTNMVRVHHSARTTAPSSRPAHRGPLPRRALSRGQYLGPT